MENIHHFIMDCPRYASKRADLVNRIESVLERSNCKLSADTFADMSSREQFEVILGKRIGDPIAEDLIDSAVKRFLTKAWNLRAGVTASINAALGTAYDVPACVLAAKSN